MPLRSGRQDDAPLAGFDTPLLLLADCHRRIERFLGVLARVGAREAARRSASAAALDDESRTALERSLLYFREALPRHTADEEVSLFPRLARLGDAAVNALLATLHAEHELFDSAHARIEELGTAWLAVGEIATDELAEFTSLVADLEVRYATHLAREETELFPLAQRRLDSFDLLAVGIEMRARRD